MAELAMEHNDCLLSCFGTCGWSRLRNVASQKVFFDSLRRVDVDGVDDMAADVLVFEAAVDDM